MFSYIFMKKCLTHTHHLGIDTELFAVAPPLVLLLWKYPRNGSILLLLLATTSTFGRFYITVVEKLSNYVYFGTSISQLFRTADKMYSLPFYRCTVYIMGIFVGYILRMYPNRQLTQVSHTTFSSCRYFCYWKKKLNHFWIRANYGGDGILVFCYSWWHCLDQRRWAAWITNIMNIMQPFTLPLDQWHGAPYSSGSFSHRNAAIQVSYPEGLN